MAASLEAPMNTSSLVQKVWNFCHTLRDDGVGYGDYLEQLTYLLFLKLAHEYAQPPYNRATHIPQGHDWASLRTKVGEPLAAHYLATLRTLRQGAGMLSAIFFKAQNKIQDPAKLARLVQLIDAENWISLGADTKGDLYEDLQDLFACYNPDNRHQRAASERFRFFSYDELMARDKASLDIFWLKDDSLDNLDDLPPPDVLQLEIIEHLEAALAAFREVAAALPKSGG